MAVKDAAWQIVSVLAESIMKNSLQTGLSTWCAGGGVGTLDVKLVKVEPDLSDVLVRPADSQPAGGVNTSNAAEVCVVL